MKQIIVKQAGGPDQLQLIEVDPPQIQPNHLLVRVEAIGVNYVDVYQRSGMLSVPMPFVPGFEGVGTVLESGQEGTGPIPGTRVAWVNCRGSYAETLLLPMEQAIVLPTGLTMADSLLFQALTAQYLAQEYRAFSTDDTVLIHAAGGGVGQILVQWAHHLGARVIATASSPEKLNVAQQAGADVLINYTQTSFKDRVLEKTGGRGVQVVFDSVGKATFADSIASLARGGTAVSYGSASGPVDPVEVMKLLPKALRVAGGSVFAYIGEPTQMQQRAASVIAAVQEGWLRLPQVTTFSLADAAEAHKALESRKVTGKVLLLPA